MRSARASRQAAIATRRTSTSLERAHGRELLHQRRLERLKLDAILVGQHTYLKARMPCLNAFCAERALPAGVFGPRDFAPFLRLASARALDTGTAARSAAPNSTWRDSFGWWGSWTGLAERPDERREKWRSLTGLGILSSSA